MMSFDEINRVFKDIYDNESPYPHEHSYTKKIIQNVFEEVYSSKEDEEYAHKYPDRWQGEVRKVGEIITYVCNICDKSQDHVKRVEQLWNNFHESQK